MPYLIAVVLIAIGSLGYFFTQDHQQSPLAAETTTATEETLNLPDTAQPVIPEETQLTTSEAVPASETPPPKEVAPNTTPQTTPSPTPTPTPTPVTTFKNGTYAGDVTFRVPESSYTMHASLTIKDDVVVASNVTFDGRAANDPRSVNFAKSYKNYVVGRKLDTISLSRVGGASLTTGAFNKAVTQIETKARV